MTVDLVDFWGLVFGLIVGVPCWVFALLLAAYGSAVAGRGTCGLGRRTGADISDPDG